MDPRRRGDDDVFNIYFFKHRHTGAGRYPLFHVFLFFADTNWIATTTPRDDKGV